MKKSLALAAIALLTVAPQSKAQTVIGKNEIKLKSDLMTPEALWAMGRIGGAQASPDGKLVVYQKDFYKKILDLISDYLLSNFTIHLVC